MKSLLLALLMVTPAVAQQPSPIDQAIMAKLGELSFSNTIMMAELKRLTEENTKLKKELDNAKQKSQTGPTNGSGGTQPEVR